MLLCSLGGGRGNNRGNRGLLNNLFGNNNRGRRSLLNNSLFGNNNRGGRNNRRNNSKRSVDVAEQEQFFNSADAWFLEVRMIKNLVLLHSLIFSK